MADSLNFNIFEAYILVTPVRRLIYIPESMLFQGVKHPIYRHIRFIQAPDKTNNISKPALFLVYSPEIKLELEQFVASYGKNTIRWAESLCSNFESETWRKLQTIDEYDLSTFS